MDRLSLMQIFIDIHEQGSLAAVARLRGVVPSAITQALQQLEELVGANLLIRSTRRMYLTAEGECFLADCKRIVADVEEAFERVADKGVLKGTVRVTTTNDFGRARLSPLIDHFLEKHPQVRIELVLSDEVANLIEEHFDLAIRTGPLTDSRFKSKLLIRQRRLICAAPTYWARYGKPRYPTELVQHNCLVLARAGDPQSHWDFRDQGRAFSVKVSGNRTANDGEALRAWAIAGAGVVLKSSVDVAADLAARRLESVLDDYTQDEVNLYAVYPSSRHLSRRVEAFLAYLQTQLRKMEKV